MKYNLKLMWLRFFSFLFIVHKLFEVEIKGILYDSKVISKANIIFKNFTKSNFIVSYFVLFPY